MGSFNDLSLDAEELARFRAQIRPKPQNVHQPTLGLDLDNQKPSDQKGRRADPPSSRKRRSFR